MRKRWSKKGIFMLASLCVLFIAGVIGCSPTQEQKDQATVKKIISSLSLREKAELLIGTSRARNIEDVNGDSVYLQMITKIRKYLPGAAGFTAEFPDKGITTQVLPDGPAGLRIQPKREGEDRTYYCTAFPIATVLASTWDTDLVYSVGQSMGNEVLEYGGDILLAPALNIQRDPLCGRNFEYYSEDPLIAGKMASAMVRGIQSNGVGTSIKHFVANNQETNRHTVNTIVSERALREIYLKGFEIAVVEANPWTVMSSYNKVNGKYTSEDPDLLTKILRNDWGFKGYVMTDWGGGSDPIAQMKAGNDLIMPGSYKQIEALINAVNDSKLDVSILDQNLTRILTIMLKTPSYRKYPFSSKPDLAANAKVTREVATSGMVLLKNKEKSLPMASNVANVAVFGNTSYNFISGGTGSGDVNEAYTISLIDGLKNGGYTPDSELAGIYVPYITKERARQEELMKEKLKQDQGVVRRYKIVIPEMVLSKDVATKMASKTDYALITIGRNSGEGSDRTPVEGDFYLTQTEKDMIKTVSDAFHSVGKKVVVVLNVSGVLETASWKELPDAILLAWQPGQEGGNSVVDILSGKANPSGKLAVSFPISYDDTPSSKTFPGHAVEQVSAADKTPDQSGFSNATRVPWEIVYEDDIYVGYRYYSTFKVPVSYEFGYGLSYTNFEFSNLKLSTSEFGGSLTATVDVKNVGSTPGKEVGELYISAPRGKLDKPEVELKAFAKTKILQPNEVQTLSFTIVSKDLASFDEASSSWIVEPGSYTLKIGSSSLNIAQQAAFNLKDKIVVAQVSSHAMAPEQNINRMKQQ